MAFDYLKFGPTSVSFPVGGVDTWGYKSTTDNLATINASGYFNSVNGGNPETYLDIGDLIYIVGSDGIGFSSVTAVSPNVTVNPFNAVLGPGSVGTANIANDAVTTAQIAPNTVATADLALNTMQYIKVTVSAAEWNGMFAAPKLLIAAPGLNNAIRVYDATFEVDYGGAAFAAGGVTALQYGATVGGAGPKASQTMTAATAIGWVADSLVGLDGDMPTGLAAGMVNQGIYISNATGAFTTGTSVIDISISYKVVVTAL